MNRILAHQAARMGMLGILLAGACLTSPAHADSKAVAPPTRLLIHSDPPEATVLIDRQIRGSTPLILLDLVPGQHLVETQKKGYSDVFQTIELEAQENRSIEAKLELITGLLLVRSTPSNADVSVSGLALGRTPLLLTTLPLGQHRIKIATPGYQPKEVQVTLEDRTPIPVQVDLLSESATLTVACPVTGAVVRINGIDHGEAPCTVERIPEGEASLDVRAEGYAPFLQKIKLASGEKQKITVPLEPLPASLRVISIPEQVRVYVNNEFRGLTPLDLPSLAPDSYRVRVEKEGYNPDARNVELARGKSKVEEFRLISNAGRLELVTEPDAVSVYIDGQKRGETHANASNGTVVSEPLALETVMMGEHELRLVKKGFSERIQKIQIDQGKTLSLRVTLTRRFLPDCQIITDRAVYKGVLESVTSEYIRMETAPGVMTTIPVKDVKSRHTLLEDGTASD